MNRSLSLLSITDSSAMINQVVMKIHGYQNNYIEHRNLDRPYDWDYVSRTGFKSPLSRYRAACQGTVTSVMLASGARSGTS